MDNNITLINLTVSTAMYLSMLVVYFVDPYISEKNKNLILGNFMILIVSASVLFNLGLGIWTTINTIRQLFRSIRSKKSPSEKKNNTKTGPNSEDKNSPNFSEKASININKVSLFMLIQ